MNGQRLLSFAFAISMIVSASAQQRIASDFEIAQMQRQLERSSDFASQIAARLNLGDARLARNEPELARAEYGRAAGIAATERTAARRDGQLTRYAAATSYAALSAAKLGDRNTAFAMAEEALRYESSSAKTWNLNASVLSLIGLPRKAVASARNAVAIAEKDLAQDSSLANRIDLAVYQNGLAGALDASGDTAAARELLATTAALLDGAEFAPLRRDVSRREAFEIYSSAQGDAASYLSLVNRVNLRLGALLERSGDLTGARLRYARVLQQRSDDPTALAALARLSGATDDREAKFAAAFDANPFSTALVKQYREYLRSADPGQIDSSTTGGAVRAALAALQRHDRRTARALLEQLSMRFPSNATISALLDEVRSVADPITFLSTGGSVTPEQLDALLDAITADSLTAEQRADLDARAFSTLVSFAAAASASASGTSTFERGSAGRIGFRFAQPASFRGDFPIDLPLLLTFRVLGATRDGDRDVLLLEPQRLEVPK